MTTLCHAGASAVDPIHAKSASRHLRSACQDVLRPVNPAERTEPGCFVLGDPAHTEDPICRLCAVTDQAISAEVGCV